MTTATRQRSSPNAETESSDSESKHTSVLMKTEMPADQINAYFGFSGDQVCLAGHGEGTGKTIRFGTFPRDLMASYLFDSPHWLRVLRPPTGDEYVTRGIHYEPLGPEWRPMTIMLNRRGVDPLVCMRQDSVGAPLSMPAESITIFLTPYTFEVGPEPECADMEGV